MSEGIQLIVGLGNPGPEYAKTRHNAGAWFVEAIAKQSGTSLRLESKLHGFTALTDYFPTPCRLFIPTTYMNESGIAVAAVARFYKIAPENILIAHDELDFDPGVAKLKKAGGHGGHNGLRSLIGHLSADFWRLRVGIGHPGHKDRVHDYVLSPPSLSDQKKILDSLDAAIDAMPLLIQGKSEEAMTQLHS